MKRETKYIIILAGCLILFVVVQLLGPRAIDYSPTYSPTDKNPFGAYIPADLFSTFFGQPVETSNLTIYELQDSIGNSDNFLSLSDRFDPDEAAAKALLSKVDSGAHAFISAYFFGGTFSDTLGLYTSDVYFSGLAAPVGNKPDTSDLKFVISGLPKQGYYYRLENVSYYFSTLDSLKARTYVISTNAWGRPVTLRVPWGKGYFVLNTTPLAFTNNYVLYEDNYKYIAQTMSFLPRAKTWWTSYYQIGRQEGISPLRFILATEPLKWAYYVTMGSLLAFLIFESKRKQRIIPIVRPLANTTLEFVKTIGNMYLHANDHKAIAEKKIAYFLDKLRSNFYLSGESGDALVETVARKSGNTLEQTQKLFSLIKVIQGSPQIPELMLVDLNNQITTFMSTK